MSAGATTANREPRHPSLGGRRATLNPSDIGGAVAGLIHTAPLGVVGRRALNIETPTASAWDQATAR